MNDRELLELAAKAIHLPENYEIEAFMRGFYSNWNPLINDGDALRLAVKLDIAILPGFASSPIGGDHHEKGEDVMHSTRRAIVRAAAAIGQAMP